MKRHRLQSACTLALAAALAGCAVGSAYERPTTAVPPAWKQAEGWVAAAPGAMVDGGPWWTRFGDADLDALAARVQVSNQNVAAAAAAYAQARALLAQQRATLFPTVTLDGSGARSGRGADDAGAAAPGNAFRVAIGASWEPDVWGRLRGAVGAAAATAQAGQADLAAATLAAQGELAAAYFGLRAADAQAAALRETLAAYERSLAIATHRYEAGIVARTDVLQAQTQRANAQAELLGLERSRAQLEHAIAVLVGVPPASLTIAVRADDPTPPPEPPAVLPSTLLQRRPDIAAAERRVAAAHEQVGIARSAYYPSLGLSASLGSGAARLGDLFSAPSLLWSLGVSSVQTLFDAGATRGRVDAALAATDAAAARYRQTVLAAFQDVEDQLAAAAVLRRQETLRREAATLAARVLEQVQNRYLAGLVSYTEVVTAQVGALGAQRALLQVQADRRTTAVALIQALGGDWQATAPPPAPAR